MFEVAKVEKENYRCWSKKKHLLNWSQEKKFWLKDINVRWIYWRLTRINKQLSLDHCYFSFFIDFLFCVLTYFYLNLIVTMLLDKWIVFSALNFQIDGIKPNFMKRTRNLFMNVSFIFIHLALKSMLMYDDFVSMWREIIQAFEMHQILFNFNTIHRFQFKMDFYSHFN